VIAFFSHSASHSPSVDFDGSTNSPRLAARTCSGQRGFGPTRRAARSLGGVHQPAPAGARFPWSGCWTVGRAGRASRRCRRTYSARSGWRSRVPLMTTEGIADALIGIARSGSRSRGRSPATRRPGGFAPTHIGSTNTSGGIRSRSGSRRSNDRLEDDGRAIGVKQSRLPVHGVAAALHLNPSSQHANQRFL
jgi:hypothetical protein